MSVHDLHLRLGATVAPDGIPLHYGDLSAEYHAGLEAAVLMDRSHEGRLQLLGRDPLALLQRMSTNDVASLDEGEGRATIFTNPVGRILDRAAVYQQGERALLLTEPGRGEALRQYLQRNIFFNDDVQVADLAPYTRQFVIHGLRADSVIEAVAPALAGLPPMHSRRIEVAGVEAFAARSKPLIGEAWVFLVPTDAADAVWSAILNAGQAIGLLPAGSLTYNTLRIRAGRPGVGRELSVEYIPLEVGLWDEVSFSKGCYTGQEIIARMESRGRLAKTIVALQLDGYVAAPAPLLLDGREVGKLTSSVQSPDGDVFGIGVVKVAAAQVGTALAAGAQRATITRLVGVQPPQFMAEEADQ
jgi:aminomethyltransferase